MRGNPAIAPSYYMSFLFHRQQSNSDTVFHNLNFISLFSNYFPVCSSFFPFLFLTLLYSPLLFFLYVLLSPSHNLLSSFQSQQGEGNAPSPPPILSEMKTQAFKRSPLKSPHLGDIQIWEQSTQRWQREPPEKISFPHKCGLPVFQR